jgi:ribose transport system ATP-binding protein
VTTGDEPLLQVRGLRKSYAAPVLVDVDLDLRPGEVHALLGANGAGKTTLGRIVCGLTRPDAGAMRLAGRPHVPASKHQAEAHGVQMVMQELSLVGTLTVAENLFLGRLPHRLGFVHPGRLADDARRALAAVGLHDLDPGRPAAELGVGQQQLLEVAKALARPCRVLILDEPTAALTDPQIEVLFAQVRRLTAGGAGVLYISHRLDELRRIADRATVLRDGRVVATRPVAGLDNDEAVRLMVGREASRPAEARGTGPGPVALRVDGLRRGSAVRGVSLELRRGEVLGLAGLIGSGRTELLRAVFGADPADDGRIALGDGPARPPFRSPGEAVRAGVGMVPEDRKGQGLLLAQPVRSNCTLNRLDRVRRGPGWIDPSREGTLAGAQLAALQTAYASLDQPAAELSGGNQQKVLLARWLLRDCDVLLCDEPTRGIDVAAKAVIYRALGDLAAAGKALVVVSSDLRELMALCDRIAVMSAGRIAAVFERGRWSEEALTAAAFSGYLSPDPGRAPP